jgi:pilus assembly protein CpaB
MRQRRILTTFVIALIVAAGATFGIRGSLEVPKAERGIKTEAVVVSLRDISEGRAIERPSVAVAQWPRGTVPAGAYRVIDSVIGRVARFGIYKGEAITLVRLAPDSAVGRRR